SEGNFNNLVVYAAFRTSGAANTGGVYFTPNAYSQPNLVPLTGGMGNQLRRDVDDPNNPPQDVAISVQQANGTTPFKDSPRIHLAVPALTGKPLEDNLYQGWCYAFVVSPAGDTDGIYMTKDYGNNWTKLNIPYVGNLGNPPPNPPAIPTDNDSITNQI